MHVLPVEHAFPSPACTCNSLGADFSALHRVKVRHVLGDSTKFAKNGALSLCRGCIVQRTGDWEAGQETGRPVMRLGAGSGVRNTNTLPSCDRYLLSWGPHAILHNFHRHVHVIQLAIL